MPHTHIQELESLKKTLDGAQGLEGISSGDAEDFRRWSSEILRIDRVLNLRPTTALYGVSQVGKSFLTKVLFSHSDGSPVKIQFPNREVDFINEINPIGEGQEATGVVTRFTVSQSKNQEYPVRIELMRPVEIIQILTDCFVNDSSQGECAEWIRPTLPGASESKLISRHEIQDLKDLIAKSFQSKSPHLSALVSTDFWDITLNQIYAISGHVETCVRWFEVLWGGHVLFSNLFRLLLETYSENQLFDATHLQCRVEGVLRDHGNIIDVEVMDLLLRPELDETVECICEDRVLHLRASLLSSLTKEVVLPLGSSAAALNPFLEKSDFLDFPGARAPLKGTISEKYLMKFFLRGKVRHLFRSYSQSFEINNLLFCHDSRNLEVKSVFIDVDYWISQCVGKTPESRARYVNDRGSQPWACVQTKFDVDMESADPAKTLNGRLNKNLADEIGLNFDWLESWDGDRFKEVHFLRDPEHSTNLFIGYDEKTQSYVEDRVKEEAQLEKAKSAVFENSWLQQHVDGLEEKWEGVSKPNRFGTESIRQFLMTASERSGAEVNLGYRLNDIKGELLGILQDQIVAENQSDQLAEAERQSVEIANALSHAVVRYANSSLSNEALGAGFIDNLQVLLTCTSQEVTDSWSAIDSGGQGDGIVYEAFKLQYPRITRSMSIDERLNVFVSECNTSIEEGRRSLASMGIELGNLFPEDSLSASNQQVQRILLQLIEEKLSLDSPAGRWMLNAGMKRESAEVFLNALSTAIRERDVASRVSSTSVSSGSASFGNEQLEGLIMTSAICHWWNECMLMCDRRFFNDEEWLSLGMTDEKDEHQSANIQDDLESELGATAWDNAILQHSQTSQFRLIQWKKSLELILKSNTRAIEIDVDRNRKIQGLVERLVELKFYNRD